MTWASTRAVIAFMPSMAAPSPRTRGTISIIRVAPAMIRVSRRLVAEEIENQPAFRVQEQDVAVPDQVGVDGSDDEQPEDAAIVDPPERGSPLEARSFIKTSPAPKSIEKIVIILASKTR